MKNNLGIKAVVAPLPVLIIGTYDAEGKADAMNVAWGGQCGPKHIALNLDVHKTNENMKIKQAFTCAFATRSTVVVSDYVGLVSGNKEPDKILKSGLHPVKSSILDAPVFEEFPLTLECKIIEMETNCLGELHVIGEIVNTVADESILNEDGKIDFGKLEPISFDSVVNVYRVMGEKVGNAFCDGVQLK